MFAIQNIKTGKFVYGTDYRYSPHRQRTSDRQMITFEEEWEARSNYNQRQCGNDYRVVCLKTVEVKRVIERDAGRKYRPMNWKNEVKDND